MVIENKNNIHTYVPVAQRYYTRLGYEHVGGVPVVVSSTMMNATKPPEIPELGSGYYNVASGEQGLLQLLHTNDNMAHASGMYQCTTLCHRPHDKDRGEQYLEWFLKVELMSNAGITAKRYPADLWTVVSHAVGLYTRVLQDTPKVVRTDLGFDVLYNGVELGSYGHRKFNAHKWIYGTGFVPFRTAYAAGLPLPPC